MQFSTTVTQKGQATIPAHIRKSLGIRLNTKITFELNEKNEAVIKPVADFLSLKGSIKSKKPFNIRAMDKAVEKYVVEEYVKKHNRH
mgnify:CR=1 FL=1